MRISDWSSDVCSSDLRGWSQPLPTYSRTWRFASHPAYREVGRDGSYRRAGNGCRRLCAEAFFSPRTGGAHQGDLSPGRNWRRSEEHTSELPSLMRNSYAVFLLNKTKEHYSRTRCKQNY